MFFTGLYLMKRRKAELWKNTFVNHHILSGLETKYSILVFKITWLIQMLLMHHQHNWTIILFLRYCTHWYPYNELITNSNGQKWIIRYSLWNYNKMKTKFVRSERTTDDRLNSYRSCEPIEWKVHALQYSKRYFTKLASSKH